MSTLRTILTCTDGSFYSEISLNFAIWFARQTKPVNVMIQSLYVSDVQQYRLPAIVDLSGSLGVQPYQDMISRFQELEEEKAMFIQNHIAAFLKKRRWSKARHEFLHRTGLLVDCVKELEPSIDLVILGKRGETEGLASDHLGSNLERVIRTNQKPCMVTPRRYRPIKKILLGYDRSPSSAKALDFMVQSKRFDGLDWHLVTAAEEPHANDRSLEYLRKAESLLQQAGSKATCQMLLGPAEDVIVDYIEKQNIDLLLMGAYGHSRIRRLLIGSTTTLLLNRCHIPILLFR